MRKKNWIKQNLTILFVIFSTCKVFAQTDLYIHYEDKKFDEEKSAFVKNELNIENDTVSFFETRYKMDFTDSICKRMIYVPINKGAKEALLELLNKDINSNTIFDSKYYELKFDKKQTLSTPNIRRFQIRVNGIDYYLYDFPNENESEFLGLKNNPKKFEQIMKSIESCMRP